jgi:pimeloyl-ACP methyl ester carboxylesterase
MSDEQGYVLVDEGLRSYFPPNSQERDWRSRLASVEAHTLVINGMEDLIPVEAAHEWVAAIPDAHLLSIPGVGHFPHLEAPEIFFPAVHKFFEGAKPEGVEA